MQMSMRARTHLSSAAYPPACPPRRSARGLEGIFGGLAGVFHRLAQLARGSASLVFAFLEV